MKSRSNLIAGILLVIGLSQMAGDLLQITPLKGLGAASMISPAPKVFSSVKGLETYSTRIFLEWNDREGAAHSMEFTPENYSRIQGPYNRRNVYGAVIAYGPVLAQDKHARGMLRAITAYALTGCAPMLVELGIDPQQVVWPMVIRYQPIDGTDLASLPTRLEIPLP